MGLSPQYKAFAEDLFASCGPVSIRAMFGGAGVFRDGIMFALIADESIYLKADDTTRADFESAGMRPFSYEAKGRRVSLSYWEVPDALYDDPGIFREWADRAFAAACALGGDRQG